MNIFSALKTHNKLTKREFFQLKSFFEKIQPPCQNELYGSGDHYWLYKLLCDFGCKPPRNAIEVYDMAQELLLNGHE